VITRPSNPVSAPNGRRRSKRAGYTILEVAIASFVMVMGLTSSIVALQRGFLEVELARSTTIASQILQSEMERIRMMSWAQVNDSAILPANSTFDGATNFSTSAKLAGKYSVTRRVTSDSTRPTEVKNIAVSVNWSSIDGVPHVRTLTAIYAKNGLYDYYYTIAHD
jgi:Tfp pilus assembly protein PilV